MSPAWDVGKAELVAEHKRLTAQQPIQELKMSGAAVDALFDRRQIPLRLRGPIEAPKNAYQKIRLQCCLRPIQPLINTRTFRGVIDPERTSSITCGQVTQNCMRFPNDCPVVVYDRNTTMRVHCPKLRGIQTAKLTTGLDVSVFNRQFPHQPHDLLKVEGTTSSPNCQQKNSPSK